MAGDIDEVEHLRARSQSVQCKMSGAGMQPGIRNVDPQLVAAAQRGAVNDVVRFQVAAVGGQVGCGDALADQRLQRGVKHAKGQLFLAGHAGRDCGPFVLHARRFARGAVEAASAGAHLAADSALAGAGAALGLAKSAGRAMEGARSAAGQAGSVDRHVSGDERVCGPIPLLLTDLLRGMAAARASAAWQARAATALMAMNGACAMASMAADPARASAAVALHLAFANAVLADKFNAKTAGRVPKRCLGRQHPPVGMRFVRSVRNPGAQRIVAATARDAQLRVQLDLEARAIRQQRDVLGKLACSGMPDDIKIDSLHLGQRQLDGQYLVGNVLADVAAVKSRDRRQVGSDGVGDAAAGRQRCRVRIRECRHVDQACFLVRKATARSAPAMVTAAETVRQRWRVRAIKLFPIAAR